jgi:predicted permease
MSSNKTHRKIKKAFNGCERTRKKFLSSTESILLINFCYIQAGEADHIFIFIQENRIFSQTFLRTVHQIKNRLNFRKKNSSKFWSLECI